MPPRRWIEYSGTLSNSATTLPDSDARRGVIISNNSDTVMTFRIGGTATAAIGVSIPAGTAVDLTGDRLPDGEVSLFCAGASKAYTIYELVSG